MSGRLRGAVVGLALLVSLSGAYAAPVHSTASVFAQEPGVSLDWVDNADAPDGVATALRGVSEAPEETGSIYWPVERHDSQRTGFNPAEFLLRPPLELKWSATGAERTDSLAHVVALDGLVFTEKFGDGFAYQADTGSLAWTHTDIDHPPRAVKDGRVFYYDTNDLAAVDATSGSLLWRRDNAGGCANFGSCPDALAFDGDVVVNGIKGFAETTGETLWASGSIFECGGHEFAVTNGTYYQLSAAAGISKTELTACDVDAGGVLWNAVVDGGSYALKLPAITDGRAFFTTWDQYEPEPGYLYSVDAVTGGDVKSYTFLGRTDTAPALAYGRAYIGGDDGIVRAIDTDSMTADWQTTLIGEVNSDPAVANGYVYLTTDLGGGMVTLHSLDAYTGEQIWSIDLADNGVDSPSPIVASGSLFIVAGGSILAFGNATPPPRFIDTDGSIFEDDILWLADQGITQGCNPPQNDRFCPDDVVTRGQMASFLTRALGLTEGEGSDLFRDDEGSVHERNIDRLGTAGITRGCNPPVNDQYCPDQAVTRSQMAAFLVRALGLTDDGGGNSFTDDDGSVFELDIAKLAAAGITRGCNPPVNDKFCPNSFVARGQMAAFLHRALG